MTEPSLEALVARAVSGDRAALEGVVARIQDRVYGLALRMLWHPEDARDATQEILIRVVTHLASFRGESAFTTWVYQVASNALRTMRRSRLEASGYTFERFGRELAEGLSEPVAGAGGGVEEALLLEEIKIGCTHAMLVCLDRPHRLAYILGEILELESGEAATVLGIAPAAFRKRLSRARRDLVAFMQASCGLVNPERACRCRRRLGAALAAGRVDPERLRFARDAARARRFPEVLAEVRRLEAMRRSAALYRSHGEPECPAAVTDAIRRLLDGQGPSAPVREAQEH